jgi:hypothetical protein
MFEWQKGILLLIILFNLLIFFEGIHESREKKNAYGFTPVLFPLGIFVWGDAILIGLFWACVALVCLFINDWILFLLIFAAFWTIRAFGESIYWFNQQFSKVIRYKPEDLPFYFYTQNDAAYFMHQVFAQLVSVVALIFTIYYASLWIR